MMRLWSCSILFSCLQILGTHAAITCRDNKGSPVDWFIAYKLPRLHENPHPLVKKGLGHFYMDVNNQKWQLSERSLNDTDHAIYYTLQQVYKNYQSKEVAYLLYNDEKPEKAVSFTHGHTKGDVVFDHESGYWLVHSLPRFPPRANESYSYPHSGLTYGQTFLCVTYPAKVFDAIGIQMLYNYPWVYDFSLPEDLAKVNPNIAKVTEGEHVKSQPWNNMVNLVSSGGQKFISFAKYVEWDADLYDAWIAPYFRSEVYAETWQNGRGKLPSNCTAKYKVLNIQDIQLEDVAFKETHDHSKWALTVGQTGIQWTCIGDINRSEEQAERAGGTVCFNIPDVWKAFDSSVSQVERCDEAKSLEFSQTWKHNHLGPVWLDKGKL